MSIQYLSDQTGRTTAVVIPIEEWEVITQRLLDKSHQAYRAGREKTAPAASPSRPKPSEYRGVISPELAEQLHQHVQEARQEWDRNSS